MDLSQYQLKDFDEINRWCKTEPERFGDFISKVYQLLDDIPEGQRIRIVDCVNENDHELFIKCVCLYILEKRAINTINDSFIEFYDEDFTIIRRHPGWVSPIHREINRFYNKEKK